MALALPLYEAPKNLLCALYVIVWAINRLRTRDAGGPWAVWDTLFLVWIGSGFVVAAGAGIHDSEWAGATDPVRYGLVAWCASRGRYRPGQWMVVLLALIASGLIGLVWGFETLAAGRRHWLELHSVGHVNHSAIYLAILAGACASLVAARWTSTGALARTIGLAVTASLVGCLIVMASRGAFAAALACALAMGIGWWPRSRRMAAVIVLATGLVGAGAWLLPSPLKQKSAMVEQTFGVMNGRDDIWRVAWREFVQHPWFGVGMDNYSHITKEHYEGERAAGSVTEAGGRLLYYAHAHSLLLNTLAERGLAGTLPLAAVILAWAWSLLRRHPAGTAPPIAWTAWGAALWALGVTLVAGLVNTSLHHEHAILATLMLGLWLDNGGQQQPASQAS
jgi:O-antigen ligase